MKSLTGSTLAVRRRDLTKQLSPLCRLRIVNGKVIQIEKFKLKETIKVGLLAQSPTGDGGTRIYENFVLGKHSVNNIRMGE